MNRKELQEINESFQKKEERLKSLEIGQLIYEEELQDPVGGSYFRHEVVYIDLDEMCVNTLDLSQNKKPIKLYGFYLPEEVNLPKYIIMEKRFKVILKLEELSKKQEQKREFLGEVNRIKSTFGLSDATYNEIVGKINKELDSIHNQIFELKESL